jgi:tight adherence protein C
LGWKTAPAASNEMRSRSGFDAALAQVARNTSGPLAAGLARALQEMQTGKSRTGALRFMAGRITAPGLRAFPRP